MKLINFRNSLLIFILSLITGSSFAQQNENITFSEERKDTSDYRYRRLYQYLDINMKDEKIMFKISPDFSLSKYYKAFSLQLSYEQKVYNQFSFLVNNQSSYYVQKVYGYNFGTGSSSNVTNEFFHTNLGAGIRWYYSLNRRIKNGVSGNNLSGMYAEAGLDNIAYYSDGSLIFKPNGPLTADVGFRVFQTFDLYVAIGFQRRFNNWSYYNLFATAKMSKGMAFWDLGFRLGLAWGK